MIHDFHCLPHNIRFLFLIFFVALPSFTQHLYLCAAPIRDTVVGQFVDDTVKHVGCHYDVHAVLESVHGVLRGRAPSIILDGMDPEWQARLAELEKKINEMYAIFQQFEPMLRDYARLKDAKGFREQMQIVRGKGIIR
jgi:hypothetical protein